MTAEEMERGLAIFAILVALCGMTENARNHELFLPKNTWLQSSFTLAWRRICTYR
jgi:hypothetical protein